MRKITLPDWAKKLPDDAQLISKEVLPMFGYPVDTNGMKAVRNLIERGHLLEPSFRAKGFSCNGKLRWVVADLKKYERECKIVVNK